MIKSSIILKICLVMLLICCCDDPLSENKKIVKTLVNYPLYAGQYSIFWDGTDDHNRFVEAGTYIALLYTRNFTLVDTLTALEGTKGNYNRNEYYNDFPQLIDIMEPNEPDPFYIREGTNIRFSLSDDFSVRLTIQSP